MTLGMAILQRSAMRLPNILARRLRSSSSYFVSTPIFYVNGAPHIGHMQSCLYADVFARIHRLLGKDVLFSTGTDEHGLKVQQVSESQKKHPMDFCTEMSQKFEDVFKRCDMSFTNFIRTTDETHKATVLDFWNKLKKNGHIRKGSYEGWYSVIDEAFVPSSQVMEIKEGNALRMVSAETGSPVEKMSEENYIFSLAKFRDDLLYWLSKDVVQPDMYADKLRRWIDEGLNDLSVSRPKSRLMWGIPVPDDDTQIIYVWLDALINYLTVSSKEKTNYWPVDCHVIGKDILKFHGIYWPAFLMAAGYEPPSHIFCHAHWTVNYEKMSKSKGNVIDPLSLIEKYGCDGFRYFLLRASVPHSDTNYSEIKIHRMLNSELADNFGNLLSRSCAPALNPEQIFPKFYHGVLDSFSEELNVKELINNVSDLPAKVREHFMTGYFYRGIDLTLACLRNTNAFVQFNKPWELIRQNDQKSAEKLSTLLHIVLEILRISGILFQPLIPTMSNQILNKLQIPERDRGWTNIVCFPSYNKLSNPLEGQSLGNDSKPLFERRKS